MKLPRIGVKYAVTAVTAKLANGTLVTNLTGVDVAVLAPRVTPSEATVWTPSTWTPGGSGVSGTATVLLAGPQVAVPPVGALLVAEPGGDLWARVIDNPEIDASLIDHIDLV